MKKLFIILLLLSITTSVFAFDVPTEEYSSDAYTVLLLHCDGADTSTDFPDSGETTHTVTANGSAQVDTAQYEFATGSCMLNPASGAGDYLSIPNHADFNANGGDYTIDLWVMFADVTKANTFFECVDVANGYAFYWYQTNKLYMRQDGGDIELASWTPSDSTWYHVALTYDGTTTTIYVDGSSLDTDTGPDFNNDSQDFRIGGPWLNDWAGWLDEIRISKGVVRDWAPPYSGEQFIWISKFINNLNPDKIGTPMWSCKIKMMGLWKNFYWRLRG